jgi:alcohol dehydrogenase
VSAYHPNIAHGAGLIMLSEAYHSFFMKKAPDRYTDMAKAMGEDVVRTLAGRKASRVC